jgi:hypothetical protein
MLEDGLRAGGGMPAFASRMAGAGMALLMLASAAVSIASGQSPAPSVAPGAADRADVEALPSARSILDRHVEAIGGREALQRHRSTHVQGTLSMPSAGITGSLDLYAARPNKSLLRVSLGGVGEVTEAFDGTHGWSVSPLTGPMLLEGRQLEEKRFDADYEAELTRETRYVSMTTLERVEFDGRECYKLRLERKMGGEDFEFYDVGSGLKAGGIATRETPMGAVTGTTIEADYRRFGSLLHPTVLRSRVGGMEQVITVTSIEYDTVQPSVFDMPPDIKALLK